MKRLILLVVLAALLMNGCTPSLSDESSVNGTLSSEEMRIKEDLDMYDALIMRFMDADPNALNEKQLTVAALITFDAEMMNGGLCQFFANDYNGYAQHISDALGAVGAIEIKIHKYDLLENRILFVRLEDDDRFPSELNGLVAMIMLSILNVIIMIKLVLV